MSIQSDKAPKNLASVCNFSLQTTLPNRALGFALQKFEFPFLVLKACVFVKRLLGMKVNMTPLQFSR
jgi:hypothetical protein